METKQTKTIVLKWDEVKEAIEDWIRKTSTTEMKLNRKPEVNHFAETVAFEVLS